VSRITTYCALAGRVQRRSNGDGSTVVAPTPVDYGPVSVPDVASFISRGLGSPPSDANYVMWRWATGTDLFSVFQSLGANDILVLPEDPNPYVVSQMYRTSDGTATGSSPQTDLAACRSRRGIIGLGPNAVIAPSSSFPTYAAQTGTAGVRESLVENWTANAWHGNFTIKGRNVGGLAYHGLRLVKNNDGAVERVKTINHYGFLNHEPGEAFGIIVQNHTGSFTIRHCEVDGRNASTGVKEGSGGIHLVKGGTVLIDTCYIHDTLGHGVAHYQRAGATTIQNTLIASPGTSTVTGSGINAEVCGTQQITLNNCDIEMNNAGSGNTRPHVSIVACNTTGDLGAWPLGSTPVFLNSLAHDQTTAQVWVGGAGTYHGASNIEAQSDIHLTNTTATFTAK
jgi:hypothetical protein